MECMTEYFQLAESFRENLLKLQCLIDNHLASRQNWANQGHESADDLVAISDGILDDELVDVGVGCNDSLPDDQTMHQHLVGEASSTCEAPYEVEEITEFAEISDSFGCYHEEVEGAKFPFAGVNADGLRAPIDLVRIGAPENVVISGIDQVSKLKKSTLADDPYWTTILTSATQVRMRLLLSQLICPSTCDLLHLERSCVRQMMRLHYGFNGPGSLCSIVRTYDGFNGPGSSQGSFNFGLAFMRSYDGFNGPGGSSNLFLASCSFYQARFLVTYICFLVYRLEDKSLV